MSGARNPPRAHARGGPRPRIKARRGRRIGSLGSAGLWRPRGSLVPASSDGTLPAARPPLFGAPRSPLRVDLRGAVSALRARPARSGRGADVFGPSRPAPDGAFREEALQSRRPPESDATERPPRDRLPSACMTRCARGSSPEGSAGTEPRMGIDVKDFFSKATNSPHPEVLARSASLEGRTLPGQRPTAGCVLRGSPGSGPGSHLSMRRVVAILAPKPYLHPAAPPL